jgi:hypothetical protein
MNPRYPSPQPRIPPFACELDPPSTVRTTKADAHQLRRLRGQRLHVGAAGLSRWYRRSARIC